MSASERDVVPMAVCWRMFDQLFRRAICALGDVHVSAATMDWNDLSGKDRAGLLAVLQSMADRR